MKTPIYDAQWAQNYNEMAEASIAGRAGLYRLGAAALGELGESAHILIVGAGVGTELLELGARYPRWQFTAVEPAAPMLEVARQRIEAAQFADRVHFISGYLESVPQQARFDGATAILVSQHLLDEQKRRDFYLQISRLLPIGAPFYNAELCGDANDPAWPQRMEIWKRQAVSAGMPVELGQQMRARLGDDVALVSPEKIGQFLSVAGFCDPMTLFQSLHYAAFFSRRVR